MKIHCVLSDVIFLQVQRAGNAGTKGEDILKVVYNFIDESLVTVDSIRNRPQRKKLPRKQTSQIIDIRHRKRKNHHKIQKATEDDDERRPPS